MTQSRIEVYCDSQGVWYTSSRERLIRAGLATDMMFPAETEAWRGNGIGREPDELLWSIQRLDGNRYKVMWGLATEETE